MGFFVDRQNRRKSPLALAAFGAAIGDLLVFLLFYGILAEPLYRSVSLGTTAGTNAVHALVIAIAGTAVCCVEFLLPDKRIAPYGFLGLAIIAGMFLVSALVMLEGESRQIMLEVIALYALGPVLLGNAVTWGVYAWLRRTGRAEIRRKTLREELLEAVERDRVRHPLSPATKAQEASAAEAPETEASAPEPAAREDPLFTEPVSFPTPYRTAQDEAMLLYGEGEDDEAGDH